MSFREAKYAFADPRRVIAKDIPHSTVTETRYYCFGRVDEGVLTVRFTYRDGLIRISVWATGVRAKEFMTAKTKYTDERLGEIEIVEDFLPRPEELAFEDETVKITIALSKTSVDFFKQQAAQHKTSYQKMIRRLLDAYAKQHGGSKIGRRPR